MDESSGYSVTIDEAFEFALDRLGYKKLKQSLNVVIALLSTKVHMQ